MAIGASGRITHYDHSAGAYTVTNDTQLAIVLSIILDFEYRTSEDYRGVSEIEPTIG